MENRLNNYILVLNRLVIICFTITTYFKQGINLILCCEDFIEIIKLNMIGHL